MTTTTLPSGTGIVTSYTYDDGDRLTDIEHVKNGSTTIASVAYTLDDVGNRTQRVNQRGLALPRWQGTHTYAYDDLYRLTSVTYPGPSTTTYAFDAFGNREEMTTSAGTTTYAYDDADRITEVQPPSPAAAIPYDWDDNGNLVERGADEFVWDYEDRMVEALVNSVVTTFAYRGDGLRNSRTVGMTTTTFTWDINAGLPVVLDDGNQYVYGAGLSSMKQGGNWYYYLADGLGSTMAIVDASGDVENGYTYDVYGEPTVTGSLGNEFDFAGQQTDPSTGLQYLRARYYDPQSGVFLSREPLASASNWIASSTSYAGSDPVNFLDPSGLAHVTSDGSGAGRWRIRPPEIELPGGLFWEQRQHADGQWTLHLCQVVRSASPTGWAKDCGNLPFAPVTIGEYERCSVGSGVTSNGYSYQTLTCIDEGTPELPSQSYVEFLGAPNAPIPQLHRRWGSGSTHCCCRHAAHRRDCDLTRGFMASRGRCGLPRRRHDRYTWPPMIQYLPIVAGSFVGGSVAVGLLRGDIGLLIALAGGVAAGLAVLIIVSRVVGGTGD